MSKVLERTRCPKCEENGGDRSGDNLTHFLDGGAKCFACGYAVLPDGFVPTDKTYHLPEYVDMPKGGIQSKGITHETVSKFGLVRLAKVDNDGVPLVKPHATNVGEFVKVGGDIVALPYYSFETGQMVGAKLRKFGKKKLKSDGTPFTHDEMWYEGDTKNMTWFGINAMPPRASTLVLCESETDAMSVAQVLPEYAVLASAGADRAVNCVKQTLHILKKFRRIVVLFDNDEAGRKGSEATVKALPAGKTYVAHLPSSYKDVNEMLADGLDKEIIKVVSNATQVVPKGVVDEADFESRLLDLVFKREGTRGSSSGFPEIDAAMGGLAGGKMLTICGGTGSGKSYLAESIAINAALIDGVTSFYVPLEMTDSQVGGRMLQQLMGQPIISDPYFDINQVDPTELKKHVSFIKEHIKFYKHFGNIEINKLIETCEFAIDAYGAKLIVLDHFTAATGGAEWKEMDTAALALKEMALRNNVCIVLVSHISRGASSEDVMPSLKDIRGSEGIAQASDMVLAIMRPRDKNEMTVKTIKIDRMVGAFSGAVEFTLKMQSYKMVSISGEGDTFNDNQHGTRNRDKAQTQTERRVNDTSKEYVREGGRTNEPNIEVRTDKAEVHSRTHLYSGLAHTGNEQIHRNESLPNTREQNDISTSKKAAPRVRAFAVAPPFSTWQKTLSTQSNNL